MKKTIIGLAVFALHHAFAQMGATPALQNNWTYPTSPSPEQTLQNGLQPIQNAVNNYSQEQFTAGMQSQEQMFAAEQQQQRLMAAAAAQQRELQAEKDIEAMREKANQEEFDQSLKKAQDNAAMVDLQVKQVSDANESKIEKGLETINGFTPTSTP